MITGVKKNITKTIIRRLFIPLSIIFIVFTGATLGFYLIPGETPSGVAYSLTFFDAAFIVTYTATTIGFGEIPYPFTADQKIWMMIVIYTSVIAWLINIASILKIVQDKSLWREVLEISFEKHTEMLDNEFYLVLGFGRTGEWVSTNLDNHGYSLIIIESDSTLYQKIASEKFKNKFHSFNGDYSSLDTLRKSGIFNYNCKGAIITGNNIDKNKQTLSILKSFNIPSITKANNSNDYHDLRYITNSGLINIEDLSIDFITESFIKPHIFYLKSLLDEEISDSIKEIPIPKSGVWIVFGDNMISRKISSTLEQHDNTIIPLDYKSLDTFDHDPHVNGIICCQNDIENFSAILLLRDIYPDIFTITYNSKYSLSEIYTNINVDIIIKPWWLFVDYTFTIISEPMIQEMIRYLYSQPPLRTLSIIEKISKVYEGHEKTAKTRSVYLDFDEKYDSLIYRHSQNCDIIFSSKLLDDFDNNTLFTKGDTILISSSL
jgi:Trk K+ transport system NAD-binding subunit